MKPVAIACSLALLAAQSGCGRAVPSWRLPDPPPEELRRSVVRIAVVLDGDPPRFLSLPLAGACSMAAVGALAGAGYGAAASFAVLSVMGHARGGGEGAALLGIFIVAAAALVAVIAIPLGAFGGGLSGLFQGRSAAEIERGRAVLQRAADRAGVPEAIRAGVLDALSRETEIRVVDPASADALLSIGRPFIGLAGARAVDPPLRLYGEVRFRLLRGKAELHAFTLGFASVEKSFQEWTAGEGALAGAELARGTSRFAARAVEEFFLLEGIAR
jgi:hypothetical protein